MIKNTPHNCMGSESTITKLIIALRLLSNPITLVLDKLGLVKQPQYKTKQGIKFITRGKTTDINDAVVVLSGNEYPKQLVGLETINSPIVLDCGGHIGTFALLIKNWYSKAQIYSIEPAEGNINLYQKNVHLNNLSDVTLIPKALYGSSGKHYIDIKEKSFDALQVQTTKPNHDQYIEIETITFAELTNLYRLTKIDLMKLDIEGSEYNVLEYSILDMSRIVKRVIMEYHPAGNSLHRDEIVNRFLNHNWELIYETKNILGFNNTSIK